MIPDGHSDLSNWSLLYHRGDDRYTLITLHQSIQCVSSFYEAQNFR